MFYKECLKKYQLHYIYPNTTAVISDGELEAFCPISNKEDYLINEVVVLWEVTDKFLDACRELYAPIISIFFLNKQKK